MSLITFCTTSVKYIFISDGTYKFRVAAVYSNNDNKHGPTSKKFTLKTAPPSEPQAPEGAPVIVEVKPVEFQDKHGLNVRWNVSMKVLILRFPFAVISYMEVNIGQRVINSGY